MNSTTKFLAAVAALCVVAGVSGGAWPAQVSGGSAGLTADTLKGLEFRSIGPALSTGRVQDIAIDPKSPDTWYVATAFGGLWKTVNRGTTFQPVFDDGGAFNLCCVVVDPKDSNVVWLGTGENASQRSAHFGDGIYKSTDAGKTWKQSGLKASEHIGQILIDPRNSNVVYVAAQGPLFSAGGDRGLYKTTDGGQKWDRVLYVSDDTGISDIVFDPKNPDVIFASSYQRRRHVGQMIGGGPDGGIWKTTDAGKKWTKLSKGLPKDDMGRIALGVDPKNPGRVYALISAKAPRGRGGRAGAEPPPSGPVVDEAGFYRSNDSGNNWERIGRVKPNPGRGGRGNAPADTGTVEADDEEQAPAQDAGGGDWYRGGGPAYYQEIFVDPHRPDTIWSVNTNLDWSKDGGKTWEADGVREQDRHARRPSRRAVRPHGSEAHPDRQRRRHLRVLRSRRVVPLLRGAAGHAVLPRVGRQREAVLSRLRRRAGQLVALRSGRQHQPLGGAHQRLVCGRRRRRLPDAQRPRGSEHRLCPVAERQRDAGSTCAPASRNRCVRAMSRRRATTKARRSRRRRDAAAPPAATARTGIRPTSSARTIRGGSTGRASTSIAATIAATTGRASAPISRAA